MKNCFKLAYPTRIFRVWALTTLSILIAGAALAQDAGSIVGLWKTFDDDTNQPAALVQISEQNGLFVGKVTKILDPSGLPTCAKCTDYRKDKPVVGMEILSGLKKDGENMYSGGRILDPDDGEIYRADIKLLDQGNKLDLRAYLGIPLIGRTQSWMREK
jgi:uncharacterized protein (DUF2147 family)